MQSDLDFECDNCEFQFSIGQGFLGSKEDFMVFISNAISSNDDLECNPHMPMVSLCNDCIKKLK